MRDTDLTSVAKLEAQIYGPGRFARTAYRLRENREHRSDLCMTAWRNDQLAGAVRFTYINVAGDCPGALLGPLTVSQHHTGHNLGFRLINAAIEAAKKLDLKALILIGDAPYYAKAGFKPVPYGRLTLPGPVDLSRLLIFELEDGIADKCTGEIKASANFFEQ